MKKIIIKEEQAKNSYERFRYDTSFRYKVIATLVKQGFVFHGTNTEFDVFNSDLVKRTREGFGAYFTNEAYKCSEYGNSFLILDTKNLNIIDVDTKWSDLNILTPYECQEKEYFFYNILDNARNIRDYNTAEEHYNFYKEKHKEIYSNIKPAISEYIRSNEHKLFDENATLRDCMVFAYNKLPSNEMKAMATLVKNLGIDGYIIDNIYVIVNFDKLNQNLVKNKSELINSLNL